MATSNKREPTVFDIKKPKNSTSVRRLFHILKHVTFKIRQSDADYLRTKVDHDSAPCTPESSTTDGETDDHYAEAEAEDPKEATEPDHPSSTVTPKSKPAPASEPLHQTLPPVPENIISPTIPESSLSPFSPSTPTNKSPRTKPSKFRQPRKPTMITPELMQQIQTSNRKRSGAALLSSGELRTKALGTATVTNRAKEVLASPLRWSEQ